MLINSRRTAVCNWDTGSHLIREVEQNTLNICFSYTNFEIKQEFLFFLIRGKADFQNILETIQKFNGLHHHGGNLRKPYIFIFINLWIEEGLEDSDILIIHSSFVFLPVTHKYILTRF